MNPTQPGWYPDPQDPGALRWFDGQAWTDSRATASAGPSSGQPWQGGQAPARPRSSGALALIIVALVVGAFLVVGILAAIAIPVFLNQREKASLAEFSSLTCQQVASNAVALSMREATSDQVPLVGMTDAVVVEDGRTSLKVPEPGSTAFVMSCRGTGQWQDGQSSVVTVEVRVDSDRQQLLSLSWE
ncbi:MAG TPA: DUF2510 domain-containing protein [Cellulomonas sp.]|uniref:DUF2510 domain-containing protein n=1 Tax=Cellulomonas sp. TaxID=40001 RepID=UPI002E30EAF8|nr:DUF2510 domain-containing protein [Cellulomonas sp.]HEX5332995.1 DUF2510 domain-containing protein [Cellulomonas sp.]